jgi:parallel beta-helix repeat protein
MAAKPEPVGFFSYVHDDDVHETGRLTLLHGRLVGEIGFHTAENFEIFFDRHNIKWGQQWRQRVNGSLASAIFLLPVITPRFFRSQECRRELERFLEIEAKLGRDDLIFPIYYFNCPILNDPERRKGDPLAEAIAGRQYLDLRDFRFEPFTSPTLGRLLASMAEQIVEAMVRGTPAQADPAGPAEDSPKPVKQAETQSATSGEAASQPTARSGPVDKSEPPTHIVDQLHRGDFTNLTDAVAAAKPGDRIVVRPGLYREGIVIDKVVEIIGDGELGAVVIEATNKHTVQFKATAGRIVNITFRQAGGGNWFCVDIAQGRLNLEGCDITSQSNACVGIHDGADPWLRQNRIHDGAQSGVFVYENGQGVLEDNDVFANALSGVEIKQGSNPTIRRNRVHDGKGSGVFVNDTGQGVLEDNDIFGNARAGIEIKKGGNPTVRRNRIHDGKKGGIFVYENGQGVLEDNDIFGNAIAGIEIKQDGNPTVRRNRIHDGKQSGVYVHDNGKGVVEENDILANTFAGVSTSEGGDPTVRVNRIHKNGRAAIRVYDGGRGTFEGNDLRDNTMGAWDIADDCVEHVVRKDNTE